MPNRVLIALVCWTWLPCCSADEPPKSPARSLIRQPQTLVIAHRGDSAHAPENTLPAFRAAIRAGAELVELDYYHSADGIPVVFHDKTLGRTTNAKDVLGRGDLEVAKTRLQDLKRLDAGLWFDRQFAGTRIPTLAEAVDAIHPQATVLIEHKAGDAATCVRLLREKKITAEVVVQSFDWKFLRDCHRLDPQLTLCALSGQTPNEERLRQIQQTGAKVVAWNYRKLTPQHIRTFQQAGLRVWAYTVNDSTVAKRLVAQGLNGIITDQPALMKRELLPGTPGN